MDMSTKSVLLEQFANVVAQKPDSQLRFTMIPDLIKAWRPAISELDAFEMDRELRTATFLVRDLDGHYRFSHRSFQEYFYARYLLSEAMERQDTAWRKRFFPTRSIASLGIYFR